MSEQRNRYRATAYIRRCGNALPEHEHDWHLYAADPRYERCACGQARKVSLTTTFASPARADGELQPGERVRIAKAYQLGYSRTYWGKIGAAGRVTVSRLGIKRCLVDYGPFGRYEVRIEALERVAEMSA